MGLLQSHGRHRGRDGQARLNLSPDLIARTFLAMRFRTLDDADVKGKRVLVRVDFNVPMQNGEVADVSRIERNMPTIIEIAARGGKVILLSHYGRPKTRDPKESLKPVVAAVARIIGRPITFADDCVGDVAESAVAALKPGDILCLENIRFHKGE